MGNIVRFIVLIINIISYLFVEIEDIDIFISYLLVFNLLTFTVFYFFDFNPPFKNLSKKSLRFEALIKDTPFKTRLFMELKYSSGLLINWVILLFPLTFLFFGGKHSFDGLDIVFSIVIFLHLFINILILSILIRNYYRKLYILYIILIGIIFQLFNALFELTRLNLLWFSIILIGLSYVIIIVFTFRFTRSLNSITMDQIP